MGGRNDTLPMCWSERMVSLSNLSGEGAGKSWTTSLTNTFYMNATGMTVAIGSL